MTKKQLPIHSKKRIADGVEEVLHCLHTGQRSATDLLLEGLKSDSLYLEDPIQQDILKFAEAVQFQAVYDDWHRITPEVEEAANRLIEDLGFTPPKA
jgi:hypothetical protein